MELYILDSLLRRETVVDRFESCIWTERYSAAGDFELDIASTEKTRALFIEGQKLAMNNSLRVMTVETVEDKDDEEGRSLLNIKGPSLEDILDDRTVLVPDGNKQTDWSLTDTPGNIARRLFYDSAINPKMAADKIPFYTDGSLYPVDGIAEPYATLTYNVSDGTAYEKIKEVCDYYGLGFRLYRGFDNQTLYFNVYTGTDRTSNQTSLPAVIFSPSLSTMNEISELRTISAYKNVAYVFSGKASTVVYRPGFESVTGFDRKILYVDVSSETDLNPGQPLTDFLNRRGLEELTKNSSTQAIDGQVPQTSKFIYGVHYNLGDLVELRSGHGTKQSMRVTEQIFASDGSGDRSYPTLATESIITPGSWYSVDYNEVWDTAPGTWESS